MTIGSSEDGEGGGASSAITQNDVGDRLVCQAVQPDDACNECALEAITGTCADLQDVCYGSDSCLEFKDCQFGCEGKEACCESCASDLPAGRAAYGALMDCVVCDVCADACAGLFPALCSG